MKLVAELEPTRRREKLIQRARLLAANADAIDIPESPMGRPKASAAVIAAHLKPLLDGVEIWPHIRVGDMNSLALLSTLGGLEAASVEAAVLLRGDPPALGSFVDELGVEEAAALAKKRNTKVALGAMLSIRYPVASIMRRLEAPLDFYLVLRATASMEKLELVSREARRRGKKLYSYIIVAGPENKNLLASMLGDQPIYTPEEAESVAEQLEPLVDGFIVSSPAGLDTLLETLQRLGRR